MCSKKHLPKKKLPNGKMVTSAIEQCLVTFFVVHAVYVKCHAESPMVRLHVLLLLKTGFMHSLH